jgi:uncharacterized protein YdcH (DUF465 family)
MPIEPRGSGDIREHLMASNAEFQRLASEHSRYEEQLEQLSRQPYLNKEDLILETKLKKLKLRIKDEMELLVARHNREGAGHRPSSAVERSAARTLAGTAGALDRSQQNHRQG